MKSFRDSTGQEWTISVNVASLKRVRDATGIDLTRILDPAANVLQQVTGDLMTLFEVLCALLAAQLEQRNLTAEQFGERLDEQASEQAAHALLEGIIDFFRGEKRELLERAYRKMRTVAERTETEALRRAMEKLDSVEFEQTLQSHLTSGSSSANSPASSESTPAPTPSAS